MRVETDEKQKKRERERERERPILRPPTTRAARTASATGSNNNDHVRGGGAAWWCVARDSGRAPQIGVARVALLLHGAFGGQSGGGTDLSPPGACVSRAQEGVVICAEEAAEADGERRRLHLVPCHHVYTLVCLVSI